MGMVTMYSVVSGCCCKEVYRYCHNNQQRRKIIFNRGAPISHALCVRIN